MTLKLFATDLDGTLLRKDRSVSDFTRNTFDLAKKSGVEVIFATGRPTRWLPTVIKETRHQGLIIGGNGTLLMDAHKMEVLHIDALDNAAAREVVNYMRSNIPDVMFAIEVLEEGDRKWDPEYGYHREPGFEERLPDPNNADRRSIEEWLDLQEPIVKLLARVKKPTMDVDTQIDLIKHDLVDLAEITTTGSSDFLLELSPVGVNKGSALARLAIQKRLSALEIAAVGDMPNDLSMISFAGYSAAIEGGHPQVVALADRVIPGPTYDGVATWLSEIANLGAE